MEAASEGGLVGHAPACVSRTHGPLPQFKRDPSPYGSIDSRLDGRPPPPQEVPDPSVQEAVAHTPPGTLGGSPGGAQNSSVGFWWRRGAEQLLGVGGEKGKQSKPGPRNRASTEKSEEGSRATDLLGRGLQLEQGKRGFMVEAAHFAPHPTPALQLGVQEEKQPLQHLFGTGDALARRQKQPNTRWG